MECNKCIYPDKSFSDNLRWKIFFVEDIIEQEYCEDSKFNSAYKKFF